MEVATRKKMIEQAPQVIQKVPHVSKYSARNILHEEGSVERGIVSVASVWEVCPVRKI